MIAIFYIHLFWVLPDVIVRTEFKCEISLVISSDVHNHRNNRPLVSKIHIGII